jgi:hypothetical protein
MWEWGEGGGREGRGKIIVNETTNENSKCHMHISQLKKGIYVLNIIVQNILKKRYEGERS